MSHIHGCKQTPPTPPTTSDEESSGNTSDDETKKKKGNRAMGKKKYPKAVKYYTKAIKLVPDNPTYHLNRCIANSALELWKAAEADAERAVELGKPPSAKSYYQLARARMRRGHCQEAKEAITAGLTAYPGDAALIKLDREIRGEIAKREVQEKKRQEEEAAKPASIASTGQAKALLEQARSAYNDQPEEALRLCKQAREAALSALARAAAGSPDAEAARREEISILSLAGKAGMRLRKWEDAAEQYVTAIELEEAIYCMDVPEEREALSNAYNNLGIALKNAGKVGDAARALKTAYNTATGGDDKVATSQAAQILQNVGQCLRVEQKPAEARQMFERALEIGHRLHGEHASAEHASQTLNHISIGRCCRDEGRLPDAIKAFTKALEIWESKRPEEVLAEMPEMPNAERLKQVQEQAKQELVQLLMMMEQLKAQAASATSGGGGYDAASAAAATVGAAVTST